jgi:hypothetical protein
MNKQEYTHHAKFYGIPCYFNEDTNALDGINKFYGVLLDAAVWIEQQFPSSDAGFPIEIGGRI